MNDQDDLEHDWYGILGLEVGSSLDEITRANRKLSLKYHPDKNKTDPDAPSKFLLIQKAKEILTDETKKKKIDDYHLAKKEREGYEEKRMKEMSARRKHFRDELERKVEEEKTGKKSKIDENEVLQQEIKKSSKILQEMRRQNLQRMEEKKEELWKEEQQRQAQFQDYYSQEQQRQQQQQKEQYQAPKQTGLSSLSFCFSLISRFLF
jgi:DnaJ family protein C protein 17